MPLSHYNDLLIRIHSFYSLRGCPSSIHWIPYSCCACHGYAQFHTDIWSRYSYTGFPEPGWNFVRRRGSQTKSATIISPPIPETERLNNDALRTSPKGSMSIVESQVLDQEMDTHTHTRQIEELGKREAAIQLKNTSMSTLSIILTLISIALAFTYVHSTCRASEPPGMKLPLVITPDDDQLGSHSSQSWPL
jgi:hypothetical protein